MGRLKQVLPFGGATLVQRAIQQASKAEFNPIIVVVGAEADTVRAVIAAQPVDIVYNQYWKRGMGSSVAAGVRRLQEAATDSAAVAILLADQPLVTGDHLTVMRTLLHTGGAAIVAAGYNGTIGVPALFKRSLFSTLAALPPEAGARHILRESGVSVTSFPLPQAGIDIDTPEDFAALKLEDATSY